MERRPIKIRDSKWAKSIASSLASKGIKPNHISLASIFFSAIAGLSAYWGFSLPYSNLKVILLVVAAISVQLRLLCNLFDGMVAVEGGMKSAVGELYNEIPDRISDCLTLIIPAYAFSSLVVTLGWSAGIISVLTAYIRAVGSSAGAPNYFVGPMAKPQRMALITVTFVASAFFFNSTYAVNFFPLALGIIFVGGALTCYRRLVFISGYLNQKSDVS